VVPGCTLPGRGTPGLEGRQILYDLLTRMAGSVPPGSDKLIFLPGFRATRPVLDDYAAAARLYRSDHEPYQAHMTRAVMEGVAYHIRWICEAMEKTVCHQRFQRDWRRMQQSGLDPDHRGCHRETNQCGQEPPGGRAAGAA